MNPGDAPRRPPTRLIAFGLALLTVLAYWGVWDFEIMNYDDPAILLDNLYVREGLTWKGLVWAFSTNFYEYWHPIMWLSHMLDCQLFGMNVGWHHVVNLALHVANTLLVFGLLHRMTAKIWPSAMVAALFALHPIHVESVAWLAERKDVLSTLWLLLSLYFYAAYVEQLRNNGPHRKRAYGWSLTFFVFALMTKPMVVTLPFVLLLLDHWPFNRTPEVVLNKKPDWGALRNLVLEKWPFFAVLGLFFCIIWYSATAGNYIYSTDRVPWTWRLANTPVAYVRYLGKTLWPTHLAALYPMPLHWPRWQIYGSALLLLLFTWQTVVRGRSARYLAFGWLFFLGVLVPTIGLLISSGSQSMADRYMYVPALGLFVIFVWGIADLTSSWKRQHVILATTAIPLLAVLTWATWHQAQCWRDGLSLWSHSLAVGYDSSVARYNLGDAYIHRGETEKAIPHFQATLAHEPDYLEANLGIGASLTLVGRAAEATNFLAKVLKLKPEYVEGHQDMGLALLSLGDLEGAMLHFKEASRLKPELPNPHQGMGRVLSAAGKPDESVAEFLTALSLQPTLADAHYDLGLEYLKQGRLNEATLSLQQATKYDPRMATAHLQLGTVCAMQGDAVGAVSEYREALRLNENLLEALNNLAWLRATHPEARFRNGAEAVKLAERACERTSYEKTVPVGTLAAAYAEAGNFSKAVETAQKACELASAHGETNLLAKNQELLQLFKEGKPYREEAVNH